MNGHENKLAGETGEACGRVTLPIGARHGSRDGQTVIVESEILSINIPTVTKWCGRSAECECKSSHPAPRLVVLVASRKGTRGLRGPRG
jgi:hypothetical protein